MTEFNPTCVEDFLKHQRHGHRKVAQLFLDHGTMTSKEIQERCDYCTSAVKKALHEMKDHHVIHISGWENPPGTSIFRPRYSPWPGVHVPRPMARTARAPEKAFVQVSKQERDHFLAMAHALAGSTLAGATKHA